MMNIPTSDMAFGMCCHCWPFVSHMGKAKEQEYSHIHISSVEVKYK